MQSKKVFVLNSIAGMMTAFQSVVILMVLARTNSLEDSGIFVLAYATANLLLNIGQYGMRTFQVSDVKNEFSFLTYVYSRVITGLAMLLISVGYSGKCYIAGKYSFAKAGIIVCVCVWKLADAIGDVFYGEFQKREALDLAARSIIVRVGIGIMGFSAVVIWNQDLGMACAVGTLLSYLLLGITLWKNRHYFEGNRMVETSRNNVRKLLRTCFPLCVSGFLAFYIGNAPKYAIDHFLPDELQAIYGYIAMPVFVIELLNGFIMQPILTRLSWEWNNGQRKKFLFRILLQVLVIVLITIVVVAVASKIGIPVLSVLYLCPLDVYKHEFILLLVGGGMLALVGFEITILTIIRKQKALLGVYLGSALLAWGLSQSMVKRYAIMGAAASYLLSICYLGIVLMILCYKYIHQTEKRVK